MKDTHGKRGPTMDNAISKPYNSSLSLVKALTVATETSACGYYFTNDNGRFIYDVSQKSSTPISINPYTVCRNSGIKDKNENFVFEYDLLKVTHSLQPSFYGYLVWDEFYRSWKIRRRTDSTAYCDVDKFQIEVIGNIILNDDDLDIIFKQEKEEDNQKTFIDNSYCPSKFRK